MPGLNPFDDFLPSTATTFNSSSSPSRLTSVSLRVKSMKSAVSQPQASKSEEKPQRHKKARSLLPDLGKLRTSLLRPSKSKSHRGYGKIRGRSITDEGDNPEERLLQPKRFSNSGCETSPPSIRWSSSMPKSLYEKASASGHPSQTLSEGRREKLLHRLRLLWNLRAYDIMNEWMCTSISKSVVVRWLWDGVI